jgi:hypothetical protein
MKKIFASLTLAAFVLTGATAFAYAKNQGAGAPAKTMTSGKKKGKKKHKRHHAATSATPSAAAPKKK